MTNGKGVCPIHRLLSLKIGCFEVMTFNKGFFKRFFGFVEVNERVGQWLYQPSHAFPQITTITHKVSHKNEAKPFIHRLFQRLSQQK